MPENTTTTTTTDETILFDIPRKIDDEATYTAHGNRFRVKKLRANVYYLENTTGRARFGTQAEIKADIRHTLEFGTLPPRSKGSWA